MYTCIPLYQVPLCGTHTPIKGGLQCDDEMYLREEFEDTGLQLTGVIELTCMAGAHKLYH